MLDRQCKWIDKNLKNTSLTPSSLFIADLDELLQKLVFEEGAEVIMGGDFNLHFDKEEKR